MARDSRAKRARRVGLAAMAVATAAAAATGAVVGFDGAQAASVPDLASTPSGGTAGGHGVVGNDLAAMSGPVVVNSAAAALRRAGSVCLEGTATSPGNADDTIELNLCLQGDDLAGSFRFGWLENKVVRVGGTGYLRSPRGVWRKAVGGELDSVPDLDRVVELLNKAAGTAEQKVRVGVVGGRRVYLVAVPEGTITVDADGGHLPFAATLTIAGHTGTFTFSKHGEHFEITPPVVGEV